MQSKINLTEPGRVGNPLGRREEIISRILARIDICNAGCWNWQGPTSGSGRGGGYGRMSLNGRTVAHKCANRLCCNPDHLELVTHRENQRRRARRLSDA